MNPRRCQEKSGRYYHIIIWNLRSSPLGTRSCVQREPRWIKMRLTKTSIAQHASEEAQKVREPQSWTWISIVTLALDAAAATVLRFLYLDQKPFWFDECFSAEVAR